MPSDAKESPTAVAPPAAAEPKKTKKKKDPMEGWVPKKREPRRHKMSFYEIQVHDYVRTATRKNVWYYRDRMSVPRGPCTLPVLREAWTHGIIDEHTLIWGHGLVDWLPIKNVRTLTAQIRTPEVRFATWVKKTFALKPAMENVRKQRPDQRKTKTNQVDRMY